jgi:hypothetical protein
MEQTEQQTHNPPQGDFSLCGVVEKPFQPFQPVESPEIAAMDPEDSATTPSSSGTTNLSSCVRTTNVSCRRNDLKNRIELQAKSPWVVEVIEIPRGSACTAKPLTPEENTVRDVLVGFQAELGPAPVDESVFTTLAGFARSPRSLKINQLSFVGRDPATETCS